MDLQKRFLTHYTSPVCKAAGMYRGKAFQMNSNNSRRMPRDLSEVHDVAETVVLGAVEFGDRVE